MSNRIYHSQARTAQAAQTRSRILASAKSLFQNDGFEQVTIEKLAQDAGVSAPTIYALFKSKRGILRILMDEAFPNDKREALVAQTLHETTGKGLLKIAAKIARQMYDAEKDLMDIFRGSSVLTLEFKELEREREQRRYQRQEEGVNRVMTENTLKKGLSIKEARDILWAFTGRDMYRLFVIEQGWSSDKYENWLEQLLVQTLLEGG